MTGYAGGVDPCSDIRHMTNTRGSGEVMLSQYPSLSVRFNSISNPPKRQVSRCEKAVSRIGTDGEDGPVPIATAAGCQRSLAHGLASGTRSIRTSTASRSVVIGEWSEESLGALGCAATRAEARRADRPRIRSDHTSIEGSPPAFRLLTSKPACPRSFL